MTRFVAASGVFLLGLAWAYGADGGEPITATPVDASVSSVSMHDRANSSATIGVRFQPPLTSSDEPHLQVVERDSDAVVSELPFDPSAQDLCYRNRTGDWKTFTIRGPQAEDLRFDSASQRLRVTVSRDGREREFLLDIPDVRCSVME